MSLRIQSISEMRPNRLVLHVTVTNNGPTPIASDNEFATFLKWNVTCDGVRLESERLASCPQATVDEITRRFITLAPGRSLSKALDLSESIRVFLSGRSSPAHDPTGYEELVRFDIPKRGKVLKISVVNKPDFDDIGGFFVCFGSRPKELGLFIGETTSNTLKLTLTPKAD